MRIEPHKLPQLAANGLKQVENRPLTGNSSAAPSHAAGSEKALLSTRAAELLYALKLAARTEAVRHDRVAEVRGKIAAGTYRVDAAAIARAVIKGGI